jgi:hypothetical protein
MRKRIDYIAENQQSKKCQDNHGKQFHRQNIAEILHIPEIKKHLIKNNKCADPENNADQTKKENAYPAIPFIVGTQVISCRIKTR